MDTAKKLEERNAFENWAVEDMRLMADCNSWDVGANGSYLNPFMDAAWRGFKAGRALAKASAPEPAVPTDEQIDQISVRARILGLHRASRRSILVFARDVWREALAASQPAPVEDRLCDEEDCAKCYPRTAPVEAQAVPEGWMLVPIKPTPEMLKAGDQKTWVLPSRDCWAAMLAAAPTPSKGEA